MTESAAKRPRLSVEDVLVEMEDEDTEHMTVGSDDEFEDICCEERERDEYGSVELADITSQASGHLTTHSLSPVCDTPPALAAPVTHTSTATSTDWCASLSPLDILPFTQAVGPTVTIPESPGEVFDLFFTEEIYSLIVEESNRYAEQILGERYGEWEKISREELRAYFGFMILMGLCPRPALSDYWRRDPFIGCPSISERISRDRFLEISRFLHFADNSVLAPSGSAEYDRLGKVRGIMDKVSERFLTLYSPHCENSIDEAMIPFQGRSSLKQYMPAKPVKRGIKVWCRADSHSGYLCEFQVYTGRSSSEQDGLGKRVVLDLSRRLQGGYYHLYFDNYFSQLCTPPDHSP